MLCVVGGLVIACFLVAVICCSIICCVGRVVIGVCVIVVSVARSTQPTHNSRLASQAQHSLLIVRSLRYAHKHCYAMAKLRFVVT